MTSTPSPKRKKLVLYVSAIILLMVLGYVFFKCSAAEPTPSPFVMGTLTGPSENIEFGLNATINFPTSPRGPILGVGVAMTRLDSRSGTTAFDFDDYRAMTPQWPSFPVDFRLPAETEYTAVFSVGIPLKFGHGHAKK